MIENFNLFDFMLTEEDMGAIEGLDLAKSQFISHVDPETADMFVQGGKLEA